MLRSCSHAEMKFQVCKNRSGIRFRFRNDEGKRGIVCRSSIQPGKSRRRYKCYALAQKQLISHAETTVTKLARRHRTRMIPDQPHFRDKRDRKRQRRTRPCTDAFNSSNLIQCIQTTLMSNLPSNILGTSSVSFSITAAICVACARLAESLGTRTQLGRQISPCIISMALAWLLSVLGILPSSSSFYEFVSSFLVPIAASLVMLEPVGNTDLDSIQNSNSNMKLKGQTQLMIAFFLGSLGTIVGTLVSWWCVTGGGGMKLGADGWKLASALCASYIGGSINFAATSAALNGPTGSTAVAAMGVDNMLMALYIALLMRIPADNGAQKLEQSLKKNVNEDTGAEEVLQSSSKLTARSVSMSMLTSIFTFAFSYQVASILGVPGFAFGFVAIFASITARIFRMETLQKIMRHNKSSDIFSGAGIVGGAFLSIYFVTIGAAAGQVQSGNFFSQYSSLFMFIGILLATHVVCILFIGRLILGINMRILLTCSNANIGGPATALAMAEAKDWKDMKRPAMLTGCIGYAIGTLCGCSIAPLLRTTL